MINDLTANFTVGKDDELFYVFEIDGYAPEFYSGVAFQKYAGLNKSRMKEIHCPHCTKVYTIVDLSVKVQVVTFPNKKNILCHEVKKCKICNKPVGLKFVV